MTTKWTRVCSAFGKIPVEAIAELQVAREARLDAARKTRRRIPPRR
jgi:hypothetical protein